MTDKQVSPIKKLVEHYGGASKIAIQLGLDRNVVEHWINNDCIPFRRGVLVEEKTGGFVKREEIWENASRRSYG